MPKGEEHFWYSAKMQRTLALGQRLEPRRPRLWTWTDEDRAFLQHDHPPEAAQKYQSMYAQLTDGRLVEYTDCTQTAEAQAAWDDLVYLGPGRIRHPPASPEEARQLIANMADLVFMKSLR